MAEQFIKFRQIEKEDNPYLAEMIRAVFVEYDAPRIGTVYSDPTTYALYELFDREKADLWVAEEKSKIIGCCGIYPTEGLEDDTVELVKFYLDASFRGLGIGKILFELSLDSAVDHGYKKIYIESLPHFSKAVQMYENYGFHRIPKALGNSGHTSCNIWMLKEL